MTSQIKVKKRGGNCELSQIKLIEYLMVFSVLVCVLLYM